MSLLPPNSTPLERALERATAPGLDPDVIRTLWNPATCPAHLLPWLAWAVSVDEWDDSWDEGTQRRVIAASIPIHRRKGTVAAVRAALTVLGHRVHLVEWWKQTPRGVPHTALAEIEIDNRGLDDLTLAGLEQRIRSVKPARSHITVRLVGRTACPLHVACATLAGDTVTVQPYQLTEITSPPMRPRVGIGHHDWGTTSVYPRAS